MQIFKWTAKLTLCATAATLLASTPNPPAEESGKWTIKKIMAETHKGDDSLARRAGKGEVTETELKRLVAYYLWMENQPPPQGDLEGWKEKTAAISKAAMHLYTERTLDLPILNGNAERFQKAMNCRACHTTHRPD